MKRRSLALLALSLVLLAQSGIAANQKGVSVPSLGPVSMPSVGAALPSLPNAAIPTAATLPGATALPAAAASKPGAAAIPGAKAPAAGIAGVAQGVAPQIEAIAAQGASDAGSAQAGRNIEAILQGGKASEASGLTASLGDVAGSNGSAPSGLSAAAPSSKPSAPEPQAPKPAGPKAVDSGASYAMRRMGLSAIASLFGVVNSLPPAGPNLTNAILKKAAFKDAVLSDIDDTLGKYNTILEPSVVEAIVAVRKSGKTFAAITDRPDFARKGSSQLGAMDTFSSVPVGEREGLIVATNGGGKIYEYTTQGEPKLIFEEPNLPDNERAVVKEAAEIVKPQLAGLGSGLQTQDPKDASKTMEPENHGPYGYSMILQAGTPEATVKQIAHLMETEMKARGLSYEVEGRMAKDPTLPPYITFSKLNKSLAVKRIAEIKKLEAERTILIGDSMYKPESPKVMSANAQRAAKLARRLAGRELPLTGNATDRNMELGLPGAMTLSVGGTADPRLADGWVLDGKGAEATTRVLRAVASTRWGADSRWTTAGRIALLAALVVVAFGGWIVMFSAIFGVFSAPAQPDPNWPAGMPVPSIEDIFGR